MVKPGAVVTVDFPGAQGVKRRPALVVSTDIYHAARPDVVLAVITSQTRAATAPTDYVLQDWAAAGCIALQPSALTSRRFRRQASSPLSVNYRIVIGSEYKRGCASLLPCHSLKVTRLIAANTE
jgi:hypothetical protein